MEQLQRIELLIGYRRLRIKITRESGMLEESGGRPESRLVPYE
jgi:hypothetical protein